jgi:transcriptional regulator with XRE-family HTH domain
MPNGQEYRGAINSANINATVAIQIKMLRESRHWSHADFACRMGVDLATVMQWEWLDYEPDNETLIAIARVFDVGLLERFVPFSSVVNDIQTFPNQAPRSYTEESEGLK